MRPAEPGLDVIDVEQRLEVLRATAAQGFSSLAVAFDASLNVVDVPELFAEFSLEPVDGKGSILGAICPEDHAIGVLVWEQARTTGLGRGVVRFVMAPDTPVSLVVVDLLDDFGVFVGLTGDVADQADDPAARAAAALAPRSFVMREDELATILAVDDDAEPLLGWSPDEFIGRAIGQLVHPDDKERSISFWAVTLAAREIETRERLRLQAKDGSWRWFEAHHRNRLHDPEAGYVEAELFDVDDEMTALERLRAGEVQFRTLTESLPVGVIQVDANGETIFTNEWIQDLTGVTDPLSSARLDRAAIHPEDGQVLRDAFEACIGGAIGRDVDVRLRNIVDGRERICRMRVRPLLRDGSADGAIASIEDITETVDVQRQLRVQARSDELTGLPNRREMVTWLSGRLAAARSSDVPPTAVIFLDLDGFKVINDQLGHEAGDEMLVEVSRRLEAALRPGDLVARFGGDEFVAVCPAVARPSEVSVIARRLLDYVEHVTPSPATVRAAGVDPSVSLTISASIGVAMDDPAEPRDAATLIREADLAMYRAKRAGGARVEFFG